MLCENCGQSPATVHITEIINNNKKEWHLCEVCAKEVQPQSFSLKFMPPMNLHSFLAGLLNQEFGGGGFRVIEQTGRKCRRCGLDEGQFARQGLLGCGECYSSFEDRLTPLLRRIHGNTRHTGKVPNRTGGRFRLHKEIEKLKEQLKEAVAREEFERAASLRDRIRLLEKNLREGGSA